MIVSCVIVNYNDPFLTLKLIESIKAYKTLNYIVVVDNGSTDDSLNVLSSIESSKVRLIHSLINGGYGSGNNLGIKYSVELLSADKILICNPDVEFSENTLLKMIEVMRNDLKTAAISCIPFNTNDKRQINGFWNLSSPIKYSLRTLSIFSKFRLYHYGDPKKFNKDIDIVKSDCILGAFLLVDSSLMLNYGMFDERLFLYGEETVLGFKFKKHKLLTKVLITEKYFHNHSTSINKTFKSLYKRRKLLIKSKEIILKEYYRLKGFHLLINKFILFTAVIEGFLIQQIVNVSIIIKKIMKYIKQIFLRGN